MTPLVTLAEIEAAAVAAALQQRESAAGTVGVVSGGNISPADHARYLWR